MEGRLGVGVSGDMWCVNLICTVCKQFVGGPGRTLVAMCSVLGGRAR